VAFAAGIDLHRLGAGRGGAISVDAGGDIAVDGRDPKAAAQSL
jgi:hypothetical protein